MRTTPTNLIAQFSVPRGAAAAVGVLFVPTGLLSIPLAEHESFDSPIVALRMASAIHEVIFLTSQVARLAVSQRASTCAIGSAFWGKRLSAVASCRCTLPLAFLAHLESPTPGDLGDTRLGIRRVPYVLLRARAGALPVRAATVFGRFAPTPFVIEMGSPARFVARWAFARVTAAREGVLGRPARGAPSPLRPRNLPQGDARRHPQHLATPSETAGHAPQPRASICIL